MRNRGLRRRSRLRSLAGLAAALLAVSAVAVAGGTTAAASPGRAASPAGHVRIAAPTLTPLLAPAGCDSGALCFWRDSNTSGGTNGPGHLLDRHPDWRVFAHASCQSHTWDNCASYAFNNNDTCTAVMWDEYNYASGEAFIIRPGVGVNLVDVDRGVNDIASSNSWITANFSTDSVCPGPSPFDLGTGPPRSRPEQVDTWHAS
jgi:hypothetical protein